MKMSLKIDQILKSKNHLHIEITRCCTCTLVPDTPRSLRTLTPHVPHVLRVLVPHLSSTLGLFVPLAPHLRQVC